MSKKNTFYVPDFITTMMLPLRRTLVRSGILCGPSRPSRWEGHQRTALAFLRYLPIISDSFKPVSVHGSPLHRRGRGRPLFLFIFLLFSFSLSAQQATWI